MTARTDPARGSRLLLGKTFLASALTLLVACSDPVEPQTFLGKTLADVESACGELGRERRRLLWYALSDAAPGQPPVSVLRATREPRLFVSVDETSVLRISAVGLEDVTARAFDSEAWRSGSVTTRREMAESLIATWNEEQWTVAQVLERLGEPDGRRRVLHVLFESPGFPYSEPYGVAVVVDGFEPTARVVELELLRY